MALLMPLFFDALAVIFKIRLAAQQRVLQFLFLGEKLLQFLRRDGSNGIVVQFKRRIRRIRIIAVRNDGRLRLTRSIRIRGVMLLAFFFFLVEKGRHEN